MACRRTCRVCCLMTFIDQSFLHARERSRQSSAVERVMTCSSSQRVRSVVHVKVKGTFLLPLGILECPCYVRCQCQVSVRLLECSLTVRLCISSVDPVEGKRCPSFVAALDGVIRWLPTGLRSQISCSWTTMGARGIIVRYVRLSHFLMVSSPGTVRWSLAGGLGG